MFAEYSYTEVDQYFACSVDLDYLAVMVYLPMNVVVVVVAVAHARMEVVQHWGNQNGARFVVDNRMVHCSHID